jgi:hypothetical protein
MLALIISSHEASSSLSRVCNDLVNEGCADKNVLSKQPSESRMTPELGYRQKKYVA